MNAISENGGIKMRWSFVMVLVTSLMISQVTIFGSDGGGSLFIPDPVFDPESGVDVPTWRVGDHWNYSTSFEITYLVFTIPFTGWLNMSVFTAGLDFTHDSSPVYIMNITGNITGIYDNILLGIHERIYVEITGYSWHRIQDLSVYRIVMNASVSGTQSSLNGDYPFGYEYSPPLEEYDFPLIPGEEWNINTSARAPFGTSGDLIDIDHNNTCETPGRVSVPAGTFDCYRVASGDGDDRFYNDTVGNTVKRTFSLAGDGISLDAPFELDSYHRSDEETVLKLRVSSDQPVMAGEHFTVEGELTISNTVVTLLFPDGDIAAVKTLVGGDMDFTHTLTAPIEPDDTITDMDHGSFGVLAVVGALDELDVCTVTTKSVDLSVEAGSLTLKDKGNGTVDDMFLIDVMIENPSNFKVDDFSFIIRDMSKDEELANRSGLSVEAKNITLYTVGFGFTDEGQYELELIVDPEDTIKEINESNNRAYLTVNVTERPPLIWETTPEPGNITILEGESTIISARAFRGDTELGDPMWFMDDVEVGFSAGFRFESAFVDQNSSEGSPYHVTCVLDGGYLFEEEQGTREWYIHVLDVDRSPIITGLSPNSTGISMLEGEQLSFMVNVTDPDDEPSSIEWIIDDVIVWNSSGSYQFRSMFQGLYSSDHSPYDLTVIVSDLEDPALNTSYTWTITVIDVDRLPAVNLTPPPGNLSIEWNETLVLSANVTDPDGDPTNLSWSLDGLAISVSDHLAISPEEMNLMEDGTYNVTLRVGSGSWIGSFDWSLHVKEKPEVIVFVPVSGLEIISPLKDGIYMDDDGVWLNATSMDSRPVVFNWYLNDMVYSGNNLFIDDLEPGNYTLILNATTEGPPSGWTLIETGFQVREAVDTDPVPDTKEDDRGLWWLFIIIGAVVLGLAATVAFLLMSRRSGDWEE